MARSERSAALVMAATFVSRALGVLKSRAIAVHFGAGALADAVNFAYNIPNNLRKIFAEGSLSSSYIPLFASDRDNSSAGALYRQVATFLFLVMALLFCLSIPFGDDLVRALSGFGEGEVALAASLLPWFTVFLFFTSVSILMTGVLQTRRRFLAAAAAPIFYTLTVVLSVTFLTDSLGHHAMSAGVVAGSLAEALVCWSDFRRLGIRFRPDFNFSSPAFRKVMRRWAPASAGALVAVVSQTITYAIASSLAEGSVSALSNAVVFYQAPYGIFHASISSVWFPLFSEEKDEARRSGLLSKAMQYSFTFLLPSALILLPIAEECVAAILQHGAFTLNDTLLTARTLRWYLVAMVPLSFHALAQRLMYGKGRYWTNLAASAAVSAVDIAATLFFIHMGDGVWAIAKASCVSGAVGFAMLIPAAKGFPWKDFLKGLGKIAAANIPLALAAAAYASSAPEWWTAGSTFANLAKTCAVGLAMVGVTVVSYLAFKVDFLSALKRK